MSRYLSTAAVIAMLLLAGCTYFRLPILQGNIVDYDKAEKLELGMTPRQVEFLLGTPLIRDSFGSPRWDYVVYYRSPDAKVLQKNLSIYFENEAVTRIEGRDALLADWRKQKAILKKAKEPLETPHPGQFPADASKNPSDASEPHPVLPPSPEDNPGVKGSEPVADEKAAKDESSVPEPPPPTQSSEPITEPGETSEPATDEETGSDASSQQSDDYPPDMSTIYKK